LQSSLPPLGVRKNHSRPHTSNNNPYSEARFTTLKYRGDFPERLETIEEAMTFFAKFSSWHQYEHHHLGIALMTPANVIRDTPKRSPNEEPRSSPQRRLSKPPRTLCKQGFNPTHPQHSDLDQPTKRGDERRSLARWKLTF
jgi:hypothetical protein